MVMTIIISGVLLLLGITIGGTFADIDLAPPIPIHHRSAWSHGPLVPWAVMWLVEVHPMAIWFAVGFLPAFAIHLFHDMFPKAWHGGAKIKMYPVPGTLPALLSFLFLAVGVVVSLYFAWQLTWPFISEVL